MAIRRLEQFLLIENLLYGLTVETQITVSAVTEIGSKTTGVRDMGMGLRFILLLATRMPLPLTKTNQSILQAYPLSQPATDFTNIQNFGRSFIKTKTGINLVISPVYLSARNVVASYQEGLLNDWITDRHHQTGC